MRKNIFIFLLSLLIVLSNTVYAQPLDKESDKLNCKTTLSVTNNGISFIPSFSLGKPAAIWEISIGNRLTFDPQFKISLEGQPWAIILWWRYKFINSRKFRVGIGAHPSLLFSTINVDVDNISREIIQTKRFLAGEFDPRFLISDKISVGIYYLYSHGLQEGLKNTHFLTANASFTYIKLTGKIFLNITPQLYYLKMDAENGFYCTSSFTLNRSRWPISISSVINKTIKSNISGTKDFVWNVTLNYTLSKKYAQL
jgi:hypothetical protein